MVWSMEVQREGQRQLGAFLRLWLVDRCALKPGSFPWGDRAPEIARPLMACWNRLHAFLADSCSLLSPTAFQTESYMTNIRASLAPIVRVGAALAMPLSQPDLLLPSFSLRGLALQPRLAWKKIKGWMGPGFIQHQAWKPQRGFRGVSRE